jgi:hypothetical protein
VPDPQTVFTEATSKVISVLNTISPVPDPQAAPKEADSQVFSVENTF